MKKVAYLYLLSPLHTGGASQEGNVVAIAREVHTELPYAPSSTMRGRLRATTPDDQKNILWGNTLEDVTAGNDGNLTQGLLWVGDASILWFPVPSLSHGIVWITSPFLLRRWLRLIDTDLNLPSVGSFSHQENNQNLYLKDAVFQSSELTGWHNWQQYIPNGNDEVETISKVLVLSDQDCQILIQSSLWRQVKIKLDNDKQVDGGFRYEEAIPPETLMFFPWGLTTVANGNATNAISSCQTIIQNNDWQFGGQESLGRGFVELWSN
ncbi:type III-B CRISPR module RAMP protein Cmr4 [Geminocystis sp. GBBB08]|uniref:type III-B CRISPR module RAMP protein Cmr4 n=1 Tax=Geminocystis sp. GBBB08 TaxID=2604140 RepID=UPI0027E313C9|nr:type III-B CRISPR module RAMP protein Cmr4 [Geminocystis sp. GBBB08]MBL1208379.1 type III-B CRISPR module RAMP protein Cmr4 [Geminocystis sp. GBBB08]